MFMISPCSSFPTRSMSWKKYCKNNCPPEAIHNKVVFPIKITILFFTDIERKTKDLDGGKEDQE